MPTQSRGAAYEAFLDSPAFSDSDVKTREFLTSHVLTWDGVSILEVWGSARGYKGEVSQRYALADLVRNAFAAGANYEMERMSAEADMWQERAQALAEIITRLALTPADDFYRPGDHMAGVVNDAWIEKGRIMGERS